MYNRIKNLLISPRGIADYVNEKWWKTAIQVFILMIIFAFPTIISTMNSNYVDSSFSNEIVTQIKSSETIYAKIEQNKLTSELDSIKVNYISTSIIQSAFKINVEIIFNPDGCTIFDGSKIKNEQSLVLLFDNDKIQLGQLVKYVPTGSEVENAYENSVAFIPIAYGTYDEFKLEGTDFSKIKSLDDSEISLLFNEIANTFLRFFKSEYKIIIIIVLFLSCILDYMISVLFVSCLEKIVYRRLNVKFGKIFKIVLLCSTPYILGGVLSQTTNLGIFELIGVLAMMFYVMKTVINYKLFYDGGLPSMMMDKNINVMNQKPEEKNEETTNENKKGRDDDEL